MGSTLFSFILHSLSLFDHFPSQTAATVGVTWRRSLSGQFCGIKLRLEVVKPEKYDFAYRGASLALTEEPKFSKGLHLPQNSEL
jgi:hypothetical protein